MLIKWRQFVASVLHPTDNKVLCNLSKQSSRRSRSKCPGTSYLSYYLFEQIWVIHIQLVSPVPIPFCPNPFMTCLHPIQPKSVMNTKRMLTTMTTMTTINMMSFITYHNHKITDNRQQTKNALITLPSSHTPGYMCPSNPNSAVPFCYLNDNVQVYKFHQTFAPNCSLCMAITQF